MIEKALRFAIFGSLGLLFTSNAIVASDSIQLREWIAQLGHPTVSVRIQAAAKLAEIGKLGAIADSTLEPLAKCLQDPNSNVRLYATFALGRIEADTERTVSLLVPLLADPDEHVRYSSEWSICEIAKTVSGQEMTAEQSRKLLGVFASAENQMSRGSIQERHFLAVKMARQRLENNDSNEAIPVKNRAAGALKQMGNNSVALLMEQVQHPAVPALLRACEASQPPVLRAAAILSLARIDTKQASFVIQANINDSELLVRASAAYGLHLCGDTTASLGALLRLLDDQEIGAQVASLVESSEHFESEVIPVLIGWLQEGRIGTGTRSRIAAMIEADGFGAGVEEGQRADTLAINQPGAKRNTVPLPDETMDSAAMPSEERRTEFSPESEDGRAYRPILKKGDDRKVAVFYGTNRSPIQPRGSTSPIVASHVVLAGLALVAMIGCFFLFPRHSNFRYAIALLVGMGAVSTLALQMMLLTNWPGGSRELLCYGGEYSDQIQYGVCEVSIPEGHQPGELESPQMFKMEVTQDLEKHIVLTNVERLQTDAFHAAMKTELDRKGNNIFVFIHGYNVSFEDAARRTGQMAYDLKFPGAPVFYSWPSQANWYSYVTDKVNIDLSTSQIRSFLLDLAAKSKADTINLIAHSMGNVGLTAALSEMEQSSKPYFNQVVLAAPDIDANVFKDEIALKIVAKAHHTTLYTSRTDLALIASRYFNQRNRAGDSGPEVLIIDGIDTIDATAVDSSLLGHTYYGSNVTVLDDLGQLLQNQPIESRHYLKSIGHGSRPYWEFEPMQISRVPSPPIGLNR